MIFGSIIIENPDVFVTDLAKAAVGDDLTDPSYPAWVDFIYTNLGFTKQVEVLIVPTIKYVPRTDGGLVNDFKRSKDKMKSKFDDFKNNYLNNLLPNGKYQPFSNQKNRVFDYSKQQTLNDTDSQNLRNVWSTVDSTGDKFNLKKKMN